MAKWHDLQRILYYGFFHLGKNSSVSSLCKCDNRAGVFSSDKYGFLCLSTVPFIYRSTLLVEPQCEVFIGSLTCQLRQLHNVVNRKDINGFVLTQTKIAVFMPPTKCR